MKVEAAGVARHRHGLHRSLRSFTNFDHIGDVNEMIVHPLAAFETRGLCLLHHGFKVAVVVVTEHAGKVAAGPEIVASWVGAADSFKRCDFVAHKTVSFGLWFTRRHEDTKDCGPFTMRLRPSLKVAAPKLMSSPRVG